AVAFQSSQEPPEWPVTLAAPVAFVSQQSLNSPEVAVMGRRRRLQEERGGSNPEDDEDERRQEEEEKMEEEEERKVEEEEKEEAEEEKREEEEEQRGKGGEGREGRGEEEAGEVGDKGKGEEEEQDEEGVLGDGEGEEEQEEGEGEEQKEGEGKEGEEEEEEEEGAQGKGETERSNEGSGDSSGGGASGGVGSNAGGTAAGVGGGRSDSDQSSAFGGAGGVGGGNNDGAGMGGGGMEGGKTGEGGGETGGGGGQTGGFEGGRRPGGRRYVPPLDAVIANVTGGRDRPIVVVTARAVNLEFVHNWYLSVRGKRMGRRVLFIAEDYHSFRLLNRQFPMQAALIVTPKGDQTAGIEDRRPWHFLRLLQHNVSFLYNDPDMVWLQLPFGYVNGDYDLWAASSACLPPPSPFPRCPLLQPHSHPHPHPQPLPLFPHNQDADMVWSQPPFGYFNGDFDLWAASSAPTTNTLHLFPHFFPPLSPHTRIRTWCGCSCPSGTSTVISTSGLPLPPPPLIHLNSPPTMLPPPPPTTTSSAPHPSHPTNRSPPLCSTSARPQEPGRWCRRGRRSSSLL
ncbi:unnamed protein product, partial [Closterium sp. NIES-54]